jgi:hypothetical protein
MELAPVRLLPTSAAARDADYAKCPFFAAVALSPLKSSLDCSAKMRQSDLFKIYSNCRLQQKEIRKERSNVPESTKLLAIIYSVKATGLLPICYG